MHKVPEGHNPQNRSPYCGDPGALVSYLYNDGDATELAAIAAHVQTCDPCTRELASLGDTRDLLSAWSPPQPELGFALAASDAGPVPASLTSENPPGLGATPVPWWRQATPVWMQAVAATLVFGAGLAVGTSGRATTPAPAAGSSVTRTELTALEERLRTELSKLSSAAATPAPVQVATRPADAGDHDELMRRFRTIVSDSEERQRRELALRTAQVLRDVEIQRKVDMATVQNNIGQLQGTTGAELLRQRELWNQLMNNASLRRGQ
jgi:anti-sigma factor RsiW